MKRRLVRICVFLVLGAIVNVAVAWGLAVPLAWSHSYFELHRAVERGNCDYDGWEWRFVVTKHWGVRVTNFEPISNRPNNPHRQARPSIAAIAPLWDGGQQLTMYFQFEVGWPCRSLYFVTAYRGDWRSVHGRKLHGGIRTVADRNPATIDDKGFLAALPLLPLWPGFAINTVFYAGVLWLLFAAPFALRRRIREGGRRRRGLCVKCGYDLRGGRGAANTGAPDAVTCPECGTAGNSERVA